MNADQELRLRALQLATDRRSFHLEQTLTEAAAFYDFLTDTPGGDLTVKLALNYQSARRVAEVLREKHLDLIAEMVEAQISASRFDPADCAPEVLADHLAGRRRDNNPTA